MKISDLFVRWLEEERVDYRRNEPLTKKLGEITCAI